MDVDCSGCSKRCRRWLRSRAHSVWQCWQDATTPPTPAPQQVHSDVQHSRPSSVPEIMVQQPQKMRNSGLHTATAAATYHPYKPARSNDGGDKHGVHRETVRTQYIKFAYEPAAEEWVVEQGPQQGRRRRQTHVPHKCSHDRAKICTGGYRVDDNMAVEFGVEPVQHGTPQIQ